MKRDIVKPIQEHVAYTRIFGMHAHSATGGTLSALLLAAFAGAAAASGVVAADRGLHAKYGQHVAIPDRDGDGQISDVEFIAWLSTHLSNVPLIDVNKDGATNSRDAAIMLAQALTDLATPPGDPTGQPPDDAAVRDAKEILDVWASTGSTGDGDDPNLDPWEHHAEWVTQQYHDQRTTTETRPPGYPPNHDKGISDGWYTPPGSHTTGNSAQWPPSHIIAASTTWDPGVHLRDQSQHRWPPNHLLDVSIEWPMSTPNQHAVTVSRTWPPNHRLAESRDLTPNHYQPISEFDPDSVVPRGNHEMFFTNQWTHEVETSHLWWPGSHYFQISLSWPSSHSMRLSVHWPAGHWGNNSVLWPREGEPPTYPKDWPPNHATAISREWSEPTPLPPWFPSPDHSIFASAQEIIGMLPGQQPAQPIGDGQH